MLSKEQILENMAKPIHEGNCCTSWEQALKSAQAALNALIDSLPSDKIDINDSRPNLIYKPAWTARDYYRYYRQLLNMKG